MCAGKMSMIVKIDMMEFTKAMITFRDLLTLIDLADVHDDWRFKNLD